MKYLRRIRYYKLGRTFEFEAGHCLSGLEAGHKCAELHGHSYTGRVSFLFKVQEPYPNGIALDFSIIGKFVKEYVEDQFDHKNMATAKFAAMLGGNSTAENLARWIVETTMAWVDQKGKELYQLKSCVALFVEIWETRKNVVEVELWLDSTDEQNRLDAVEDILERNALR